MVYKFNKDKGWFLSRKLSRGLLGKTKRNQKNEKIQKIAVKYFLPSSFYPLEVAFLKLAK